MLIVYTTEQIEKDVRTNCRVDVILTKYLFNKGKERALDLGFNFSNYIRQLISKDLEAAKNGKT